MTDKVHSKAVQQQTVHMHPAPDPSNALPGQVFSLMISPDPVNVSTFFSGYELRHELLTDKVRIFTAATIFDSQHNGFMHD